MTTRLFNKHYDIPESEHDVIDIVKMAGLDFNSGNMLKYLARAGLKGSPIVDLEKALNYLKRIYPGIENRENPTGRVILFRSLAHTNSCEQHSKELGAWAESRYNHLCHENFSALTWANDIKMVIDVLLHIRRVRHVTTVRDAYDMIENVVKKLKESECVDLKSFHHKIVNQTDDKIVITTNYGAWSAVMNASLRHQPSMRVHNAEPIAFRLNDESIFMVNEIECVAGEGFGVTMTFNLHKPEEPEDEPGYGNNN